MDKSVVEKLSAYAEFDVLPMHMPGHKRNMRDFPYLEQLGGKLDITEIDSFDDLNHPSGIFEKSERIAAELWKSRRCFYSVNGSTGAILASVRSVLNGKRSPEVLMSRASHKSVYNAVELCGAKAHYLIPETSELAFPLSVSPLEVEKKIKENNRVSLVIITSPTYEGVISDVRAISEICRKYGVPLMVDSAHGAHLGLFEVFHESPVVCGADIVVQSLHKTLPSLTQTALVHICSDLVDADSLAEQMACFQSSSPSYILSASIDGAVRTLAKNGHDLLIGWKFALKIARERLRKLKKLRLFDGGNGVFRYDDSKLVLSTAGTELSGMTLAELLRKRYGIEVEMALPLYITAMSGVGDTKESLMRFVYAIEEIDHEVRASSDNSRMRYNAASAGKTPVQIMTASEARIYESKNVPIHIAEGEISASYIYAYPPGIPLCIPGELIDREVMLRISEMKLAGAEVHTGCGNSIKVIKEKSHVL